MKQLPLFENNNLYVFEGPDGVGKSTLCEMVASYLRSLGIANTVISFPGQERGSLGKVVHDIHHEQPTTLTEDIHPASLQILHLASHIDQLEQYIRPALEKGMIVLLDRYWWSIYAYGMVNKVPKDLLHSLITIEKKFWGSTKPKKIFYITKEDILKKSKLAIDLDQKYKELIKKSSDEVELIENNSTIKEAFEAVVSGIAIGKKMISVGLDNHIQT